MLFNSYEFILGFLPIAAIVFFSMGPRSKTWALRWLILASIFFYAWWRPLNLVVIAPSILINFALAKLLLRLNARGLASRSKAVLIVGIAFNLCLLGYFKYANFFIDTTNDAFGTSFVLAQIVLPLGLSFITFQKIAFLIDIHAQRIQSCNLQEYCLFVLFFPQLIAGPIVHFREMMPQFRALSCTFEKNNVSVGLTLFFIGLCKKVFLADGLAPGVSAIYDHAAMGGTLSFFPAWMGAVGFTLQIYFDFSGYTDMALGAARIFGIRLPPNFDSPLRASSIIDFWSRWHITLTRFLSAYIYNPLSLALARRHFKKGQSRSRRMDVGGFLQVLALPTFLTMFLSGLWHGAGYLFVLWGVLHGAYLIVNHAWRELGPQPNSWVKTHPASRALAYTLTAVCVIASMVIFRAPTMQVAGAVFEGMVGVNGVALPDVVFDRLGPLAAWLQLTGVPAGLGLGQDFEVAFTRFAAWLGFSAIIAYAFPNSLQLLRAHDPAAGWKVDQTRPATPAWLQWHPTLAWAAGISIIVILGASRLGGESEFLYWQF